MIQAKCPCQAPTGMVPQQRIIEKMNEYMSRRDYAGAERHLLYWLEEAKVNGDERGQLMLHNELAGHYRKTGDKEKAIQSAEEALTLLPVLDFEGTVSAGTTYVNAATVYNAFGENSISMELFEKARSIYEGRKETDPSLLGGLYNNMALTCTALGRYREAISLYELALSAMDQVPGGRLEQGITYLNLADTFRQMEGMEKAEARIYELLDQAEVCLLGQQKETGDREATESPGVDPGYYAFVCEKCAPTFSYYGYFLTADELKNRAEKIYAGT